MLILHSITGYYIANEIGVFDIRLENYKEDEEDVILNL